MRKKDRGAVSEPSHSSSESFAQTHSRGEDAEGEAVYLLEVDSISSMSGDINQSINNERDSHTCSEMGKGPKHIPAHSSNLV